MCVINFNISATDTDGTVVSGEARYRLTTEATSVATWVTPFAIPNILSAQTPDITVEGDYIIEVRVTDNDEGVSPWTAGPNFKVGNCTANVGPIANAGADQVVQLPTNSITLDGSGSSDPDGVIVTYLWTVSSGTLSNNNTPNPTWSGLNSGISAATLTVTDNDGATALDSMVVTVQTETVFFNEQQSQSFTKNDCPVGSTGSTLTYTVVAGTYSSTISLAAANNLALNDIAANGQTFVNTNGTCTNLLPTVSSVTYGSGSCCEDTPPLAFASLTYELIPNSTNNVSLNVANFNGTSLVDTGNALAYQWAISGSNPIANIVFSNATNNITDITVSLTNALSLDPNADPRTVVGRVNLLITDTVTGLTDTGVVTFIYGNAI